MVGGQVTSSGQASFLEITRSIPNVQNVNKSDNAQQLQWRQPNKIIKRKREEERGRMRVDAELVCNDDECGDRQDREYVGITVSERICTRVNRRCVNKSWQDEDFEVYVSAEA